MRTIEPALGMSAPRESSAGRSSQLVENVVAAFNTWAFKRQQPSDIDLLKRCVARAIACGNPVPFVLYWGKGLRASASDAERTCLDYLSTMVARIEAAYGPGARLTLILTDTHARLNGHDAESIREYFASVAAEAALRRFGTCMLQRLCDDDAGASSRDHGLDVCSSLSDDLLERLNRSASRWFRGCGTSAEGARQYLELNMRERLVVGRAFPDSIFITFNGSEMRPLFPADLPIFYMYSMKKGSAIKPWFAHQA